MLPMTRTDSGTYVRYLGEEMPRARCAKPSQFDPKPNLQLGSE